MANITGLVLSAASFGIQLGQIGNSIFKVSDLLSRNGTETASLSLALKHEYEQTQLLRRILLEEGKFGYARTLLEEMDQKTRLVIQHMLFELLPLCDEYEKFEAEYCSRRPTSQQMPISPDIGLRSLEESRQGADARGGELTAGFSWPIVDKERIERLISASESWNRRIERTIETFMWARAANTASPLGNISRLGQIAKDADANQLDWAEKAKMKQIVVGLGEPEVHARTLPIPESIRIDPDTITSREYRPDGLSPGISGQEGILIEFRCYRPSQGREFEVVALKRAEMVATLLRLPKKASFRLPRATGYYHDEKNLRIGLVFSLQRFIDDAQAKTHTLFDIISASKPQRPSLGNRFRLAHALALSLSQLQSISWVHQGIRSENIVFFSRYSKPDEISFEQPWLFGYGSSRPDSNVSHPVYDPDPERDLYRHPDRWGSLPALRFDKIHDIYALGVVLLEIALWRPVKDLLSKTPKSRAPTIDITARAEEVRTCLLSLASHRKVSESMGEFYCRLLEKCFRGNASAFGVDPRSDDKEDSNLQLQFKAQIVEVLQKAAECIS